MANGRHTRPPKNGGRVEGGFVAVPLDVLDSPAYMKLSHVARSLLLDIARQYVRNNNGQLLASARHLSKRGWNSNDVITRAKKELINHGFIHETVKGHRPNKASWYALTWQDLDRDPRYDPGAQVAFTKGSYRLQNEVLKPSGGVGRTQTAPSPGVETPTNTAPGGYGCRSDPTISAGSSVSYGA